MDSCLNVTVKIQEAEDNVELGKCETRDAGRHDGIWVDSARLYGGLLQSQVGIVGQY